MTAVRLSARRTTATFSVVEQEKIINTGSEKDLTVDSLEPPRAIFIFTNTDVRYRI